MADKKSQQIAKTAEITRETTVPFDLAGREIYAKVLRVVDGDTVELGFILFRRKWRVRCRCRHINCAEMTSKCSEELAAAMRAKEFAERLLTNKVVIAKFDHNDKYGRALVEITMDDGRAFDVAMIDGGYATRYEGRGKKKWRK